MKFILVCVLFATLTFSSTLASDDGAIYNQEESYAIPIGPIIGVGIKVGEKIGRAIADAIAKGNKCRGGCNGDKCAIASSGFKGHCWKSDKCRSQCAREGYGGGYCAYRGPTCRRPGRSCWCTEN